MLENPTCRVLFYFMESVNNMKILLVEDNEAIVLGLTFLLEEEGYQCSVARSKTAAEELLKKEIPDLLLLDIGLPDGSGFSLCRELKKEQDLPVIFLTAKEEERDVVEGFELGADDYIIKPFRNRELLMRIKSVLRRYGKNKEMLTCGPIRLEPETGKVYREEEEIELTKLEYRILFSMMSRPGKLFTREEILSGIWDIAGNFVNDNTLSVTMKRLREKLGDKEGVLIKTVRGMGYRLEEKVDLS